MNEPGTRVEQGAAGRLVPAIVAGLILVAVLAFVFQNTESAHFNFLFLDFSMPLWVMMLVCTGGGFAAGWLLAWSRGRRLRKQR